MELVAIYVTKLMKAQDINPMDETLFVVLAARFVN